MSGSEAKIVVLEIHPRRRNGVSVLGAELFDLEVVTRCQRAGIDHIHSRKAVTLSRMARDGENDWAGSNPGTDIRTRGWGRRCHENRDPEQQLDRCNPPTATDAGESVYGTAVQVHTVVKLAELSDDEDGPPM